MSDLQMHPAASDTRVRFRPALEADRAFIAAAWLRSFRRADAVRGVSSETYYYFQHRVMERCVAGSQIIIACDERDPDYLYGFACFARRGPTCVLHYVYVRGQRRRIGIGTALLREMLRACRDPAPSALVWTHRTRHVDRWLHSFAEERRLAPLYNPYLIHEEA